MNKHDVEKELSKWSPITFFNVAGLSSKHL